jgi:hypothetical protein
LTNSKNDFDHHFKDEITIYLIAVEAINTPASAQITDEKSPEK